MTYEDFCDLHLEINYENNKAELKNIQIKNVQTGKESFLLAKLFKINPSSLMITNRTTLSGFSFGNDYLDFININGESFIRPVPNAEYYTDIPVYYFEEQIRHFCERISREYDIEGDDNIKSIYELLGMENPNEPKRKEPS